MIFQYSIWVNIPCDTPPPHGWSYKQIKRVTIVTCRPRWLRLHERPPRPAYYRCGHPADGRRLLHFEVRQLWSVSCWSPARRHAVGRFPSTRTLKWLFSRLRLARKDTVLFFVDFIIIVIYLFFYFVGFEVGIQESCLGRGCSKWSRALGLKGFSVLRDI